MLGGSGIGKAWTTTDCAVLTIAFLISVATPTWDLVHRLKLNAPIAVALGFLLAAELLMLNSGETYEFIYFRF